MTNGGTPKLETPEDVFPWAIYHEAAIAEKWRNQDGLNGRLEAEVKDMRKRIVALEVRVAVFAAIGGIIGGLIAYVPSLIKAAQ